MDLKNTLENEFIDFKRELPSKSKIAIEVIAFANSKGGQIIVGYDEKNKKIVGVSPDQHTEEYLANIIDDYCQPRVPYSISYETINQKTLLIINVSQSLNKPHFLKNKKISEGTYIRIGSTSRLANQEDLARLIREGKNISYDSEQLSKEVELNNSLIRQYLEKRHKRLNAKVPTITSELLEDLYLTKNDIPTIAGSLLFCSNPQKQPLLSHAFIKAASFKGDRKGIFLDQQEITGPISEQIEESIRFILKNIKLKGFIRGAKRDDSFEYPIEILRESIVNAVIHRDYSRQGACIHLAIYQNRIEITSPGGLPGQVSVENIEDRQYNRNPIIAKRMFEMNYFDSWGQGIDNILYWAKNTNAKIPEFKNSNDQFTLTLFPEESNTMLSSGLPLSDIERKILDLAKKNDKIANKDLQTTLNLSKTQAQMALKKLTQEKLILRHGAGRATFYTLI